MEEGSSLGSKDWFNRDKPFCPGNKIEGQNGRIYEIKKLIGSGVLSHVYEVVEINLNGSIGKTFAIKVPAKVPNAKGLIKYEANVLGYVCFY
jgi:hypothetical protein